MFSRKLIKTWLILLTVAATIALMVSCGDTKSSDPKPTNRSPKVEIVNIPPDGSHFTTNPQIFWYGTDVDGRIVAYEYAVVPASLLLSRGVDTSSGASIIGYADKDAGYIKMPEAGKDCVPESCWQWVDVEQADNPNKQTIRLFADPDPNVKILQYFFVRAVDNDSARSLVDYRLYSRSNHAPDTEIKTIPDSTGYYDRPDTNYVYRGINFEWKGTDKIDYPDDSQEPTFEFFYQVMGPYQKEEIFSETVDGYVFDYTKVDTLKALRDSMIVLQSLDTLTGGVWIKKTSSRIFGVWKGHSDTTRAGYFVLKVTARDDAFVSDTLPAYTAFYMIDPKREKPLLAYAPPFGSSSEEAGNIYYGPKIDSMKAFYERVISGAGYDPNALVMTTDPRTEFIKPRPTKLELAKYKVVLVISDGSPSHIDDTLFNALTPYLDFGGNVWLWAPTPFGVYNTAVAAQMLPLATKPVPVIYFDVVGEFFGGWVDSYKKRYEEWQKDHTRFRPTNEEFVGGMALDGTGMPDFGVDSAKYSNTYLMLIDTTFAPPCTLRAVPHSGYFSRDAFSTPIWLFNSRFGDYPPDSLKPYVVGLNGRVIGLRYAPGTFKTAVYGWSMYMMHEAEATDIFIKTMNWFLSN